MQSSLVDRNFQDLLAAPLSAEGSVEYKISASEKVGLETLVSILKDHELNEPQLFLKTAKRLCPILLPKLNEKLDCLKSPSADLIFLENLPAFADEKSTQTLSLLIACLLGNPLQFQQQNHGEIVAKISPEPGLENTHSSSGRMKFGWHSDDSFLDEQFRTDYLLLAGFHNPSQVRTFVSPLESIQAVMDSNLFFELMKPQFTLGLPASFRSDSNAKLMGSPLVWFDGSRKLNIAFSEYNAKSTVPVAKIAIAALLEATEQSSLSYNLQPGNMLIFKNNRVLHARGQIVGERTIFRVYVKENLTHLRKLNRKNEFIFDLKDILKGNE